MRIDRPYSLSYKRPMPQRPHLSIVVPAYNEEIRLVPTLDRLVEWTEQQSFRSEILVVDDGSKDDTCGLVNRYAAKHSHITLLENGTNRGKGFSVGHGVSRAEGELILFSDADLSTPIEEFTKLEAARGEHDVAIGSRAKPDSQLEQRQPFYREGMGRTFNFLVRTLVFPGINDTQCGFKLFRSDVAKRLFALRQIDGFAFDVEILFIARRMNFSVVEIPITWRNDEASRVHPIKHSLQMLRDILRVRHLHKDL
jgi:dolichyl-phosphate beta-glucosyltransferase